MARGYGLVQKKIECGTLRNWAHARGIGPPYPPTSRAGTQRGLPPAPRVGVPAQAGNKSRTVRVVPANRL